MRHRWTESVMRGGTGKQFLLLDGSPSLDVSISEDGIAVQTIKVRLQYVDNREVPFPSKNETE
ncbi:MAG: hypothetical protein ABI824_17125 [Acidobacteriota bacterium]